MPSDLCRSGMTARPKSLIYPGEPGGIRTHDPVIKSHVLYRLSYGLFLSNNGCSRRPREGGT
jgi:hypothetical protein